MIKNIILDIGDVLVKSNYHEFFIGKGCDKKTAQRLEKATFFTPAWKELDRGVWVFERIVDEFVKNDPAIEENIRSVFTDMSGFISAYPYAADWICKLKQRGMKVYCFSNISDKICQDCANELQFLKYADGKILSCQEHLIKPDPAIYRLLLNRFGLSPEECIFIDDIEQNVTAAKELGLHGIRFQGQEQADQEIEKIRRSEK